MSRSSEVIEIIKECGNNPEKIFDSLNLPIHHINGVKAIGKGRFSRKLVYLDKEVYSPEIVAVLHLEKEGVVANWSEGLALELIRDAIKSTISDLASKMFECKEIKHNHLQKATESQQSRISRHYEQFPDLNGLNVEDSYDYLLRNGVVHSKSPLNQIIDSAKSEIELFASKGVLGCISMHYLVTGTEEELDERLALSSALVPLLPSSEILKNIQEIIKYIGENKQVIKQRIVLPPKNDDVTDGSNKFKTEWTLNFALQAIEECDIQYLVTELISFTSQLPRWDITAIDPTTKRLRYIEVKTEDRFTEWQLRRLPYDLESGATIELMIVNIVSE